MSKKTATKPDRKSVTGWVTQWCNPFFQGKVWIGAETRTELEKAFRRATTSGIFYRNKCTKVKVTKV